MSFITKTAASTAALLASVLSRCIAGCRPWARRRPAPFDQGGVKFALVGFISAGDFFAAVQAGAKAQSAAIGVDLQVFPGRQG